jgi:3',5'-cyclic AMP phosphodiesterase CpdA
MPEPRTAIFAIMSDLHCRLASDSRDSFLTVGSLRTPSSRHPVQALLDLIDREALRVDALLVPGDLANKARIEGLQQGWEYALEVGRKLGAPIVVPAIGNHDIDSHRGNPNQPVFHAVRNLRPDFPFSGIADIQSFFADGYCVIKIGDADLLVINTVIDHTDAVSAKRGAFGIDRIERMEIALQGRLANPIQGALMHHHPVLHTGTFLEDTDVIPTGDALLGTLRRLGCRFVIHGHKHFARLSYVDGVAVLASGSFSAMLNEFGTAMGNTFHIMQVWGDTPDQVRGRVHTWVFRYGSGWRRSNEDYAGFPYLSGFGRTMPLADVESRLKVLAATDRERTRFLEAEVLSAAPDVEYLTPGEREQVNRALVPDDLKLADYDNGQLELWRSFTP